MKRIQVFTIGESDYCEINDSLVSIKYKDNILFLKSKDENGELSEHHLPLSQIRMVRIF